jgi:hypothetical protein
VDNSQQLGADIRNPGRSLRFPDTEEATSSNLVAPTKFMQVRGTERADRITIRSAF